MNIIFYFSGTGNSLKVARDLANELGDCEIVSMNKKYSIKENEYERIGFVFPVYSSGIGRNVAKFIKQLEIQNDPYIFAVATCQAWVGVSFSQINYFLKKRSHKLHYGQGLSMVGNFVSMYDMSKNSDAKLEKSKEKLAVIVNDVKNKNSNKFKKGNKLFKFVNKIAIKAYPNWDKGFRVSSDCVACEKCKNICPVKNISMENGKPTFNHKCVQCMACIQWCPQKAINFKNSTQKRGRYHHPEINYQDLSK